MGTKTFAEAKERYKRLTGETWKPRISGVRAGFENDPQKGFQSRADFLRTVMQHPGSKPTAEAQDTRLRMLAAAGSDEQSTFSDPSGGFLVPEAFGVAGDLLNTNEADPLAGRTTDVPMRVNILPLGYRVDKEHNTSVASGLLVSRREESAEIVASRLKVGKFTLLAKSLFGMTYSTEELLYDSAPTVTAVIAAGFNDAFGTVLLREKLNGTGVGELKGINKSGATIEIAKEGGQAAATIIGTNLAKMMARCWRYGSAIWLANPDCTPQLLAAVTSSGAPCLTPSTTGETSHDCLGRPIFFTEECETLGTTGDVLLVNAAEYIQGIYQPMETQESIHVRFVNNECAFKFWLRSDGGPWWDAPLTPAKGAATLSPFVKLATRA